MLPKFKLIFAYVVSVLFSLAILGGLVYACVSNPRMALGLGILLAVCGAVGVAIIVIIDSLFVVGRHIQNWRKNG